MQNPVTYVGSCGIHVSSFVWWRCKCCPQITISNIGPIILVLIALAGWNVTTLSNKGKKKRELLYTRKRTNTHTSPTAKSQEKERNRTTHPPFYSKIATNLKVKLHLFAWLGEVKLPLFLLTHPCDLVLMLRLSLLAHPSCTCMEYCRFQRTSSMEGRLLVSLAAQLSAISATVLSDSTANVPRIVGSAMSFNKSGSSAIASLI